MKLFHILAITLITTPALSNEQIHNNGSRNMTNELSKPSYSIACEASLIQPALDFHQDLYVEIATTMSQTPIDYDKLSALAAISAQFYRDVAKQIISPVYSDAYSNQCGELSASAKFHELEDKMEMTAAFVKRFQ